jgi:basic membrane protein A
MRHRSQRCFTLLFPLALYGCLDEPPGSAIRAGWITTGPTADQGWNLAQALGMKTAQQAVPELVATLLESRDGELQTEESVRQLIDDGNQLVFGDNLYEPAYRRLAAEYPEIRFVIAWGRLYGENVSTYQPHWQHGRFLSGMVAGAMTQTGRIGYITTDCKAGSLLGINAFTLGARQRRPDVQVVVRHTGSYYAPEQARDAALALADEGIDVISVHQDEPAAVIAAAERGIWAIGLHIDWSPLAPGAVLTSDTWNWGPFMTRKVKEVRDDTWTPELYRGGDLMQLAPFHEAVPLAVREAVAAQKQRFDSGLSEVYDAPVVLASGARWQPARSGEPDALYSAPDFVQGVIEASCAPGQ